MQTPLLDCRDLTVRFGGVKAVDGLNLHLERSEILGLIGPNGAGKTTAFNAVTGGGHLDGGRVLFNGHDITGWRPHRVCAAGIARTFQNLRLFKNFTALDNVRLACHHLASYGLLAALLRTARFHRAEADITKHSMRLLDEFSLTQRVLDKASILTYGEQRRLEIARALAAQPTLLLLDEPAAGMNALEKAELARIIRHISDQRHLSILLIDHDMAFVMGLCTRLVVLDRGRVIASGQPHEVRRDPEVLHAYLGEPIHA